LRRAAVLLSLCAVVAVGAALLQPSARADQLPTVEQLRARLEQVRAAHGKQLPDGGWVSIAYQIDVAERIAKRFPAQSLRGRPRAVDFMNAAEQGRDPLMEQRGKLVMRGYRSPISEQLQGYGIYLPPDYDPARAYPLLIMLHGGSANGNLFLGVVLGNNMNWKEYDIHLWDEYAPRWSPQWIVVAPDGFGQVMWRFMGEQDLLDVIADVQKHYHVDDNRIALGGLSNGGVGAYNVGMRQAWRFSVVQAIAGAPSWLQYSGPGVPAVQQQVMIPQSGMQLAENAINTDFRYYHGHLDGGPMKPRFVEEFTKLIATLGVPYKETWFDAGHDLLYLVHRHGKIYSELEPLRRKQHPSEVRVVTGDYRANRQHWVTVTRIDGFPRLARVRAVVNGDAIEIEAANTNALTLDLSDAPLAAGSQLKLRVNGKDAYSGPRAALFPTAQLVRGADGFHPGAPPEPAKGALLKKPGVSGPIGDAYYGAMAHVYGTGDPALTDALKRAAERGAQGWPLWLWRVQQPVLADSDVTDAFARSHHLVLYGTPGSNKLLERIAGQLPIKIEQDAVRLGDRRITAPGVGVRFIYPSPLAADRYVIVQAAPTIEGVNLGHNLPDFLPDYVVYDKKSAAVRPRLSFPARRGPQAMGFFDDSWQLPPTAAAGEGGGDELSVAESATLPPRAPVSADAFTGSSKPLPAPAPPQQFAASPKTQAGQAARKIAKLIPTFMNYRARIPRAVWIDAPDARWSVRDNAACLQSLRDRKIPFRVYAGTDITTPVPAPVEVTGPIAGVEFKMVHLERTLLFSCELVARLPDVAAVLRKHGVTKVSVISAYRDTPRTSFHTLGLALDMARFATEHGALTVLQDFEHTPDSPTCDAPPAHTPAAATLRAIVCDLAATHELSSVLTPNYNAGHKDHIHVDLRPDDPRVFVR
jgi:predicted esterase